VKCGELRTANIPVRVPCLEAEIQTFGESSVEQIDHLDASTVRQTNRRRMHFADSRSDHVSPASVVKLTETCSFHTLASQRRGHRYVR
jgi:hypothetical protein